MACAEGERDRDRDHSCGHCVMMGSSTRPGPVGQPMLSELKHLLCAVTPGFTLQRHCSSRRACSRMPSNPHCCWDTAVGSARAGFWIRALPADESACPVPAQVTARCIWDHGAHWGNCPGPWAGSRAATATPGLPAATAFTH